jgi:hypothetical protein
MPVTWARRVWVLTDCRIARRSARFTDQLCRRANNL